MFSYRPVLLAMLALLLTTSLFISCKDHETPSQKSVREGTAPPAQHPPAQPDPDSIMTAIAALQNAVAAHSPQMHPVMKLVDAAFDTVCGCFYTVGKGVFNPQHPASTRAAARKTAAQHDGRRWALLLKRWFNGGDHPYGTDVQGKVMYSSTLLEREQGDTLYLLLQIPLGSIVVH